MQRFSFSIIIAIIVLLGALIIANHTTIRNRISSAAGFPIAKKQKIDKNLTFQKVEWIKATTTIPWSERDAHSVVAFKDSLFLIGGLEGNNAVAKNGTVEYWNAPHLADIWASDDGLNWRLVTDKAPWHNRRSVTTAVFHDKLWLMGGWSQYDNKYDNRIWVTEDGNKWRLATSTEPRWEGREGHTLNVWNDKLWLMGGVNFTKRVTYNDVWYSSDGYTWNQATSSVPWSPRYDHAVAVFKDKLYLTGGLHINTHATESEVWMMSDGLNWEKRTPEWPSRHGHMSFNYGDRLWVIGGWHEGLRPDGKKESLGINDTWFTDDGVHWIKTFTDGPWTGREDHMGDVLKGKMWLTGGMDTDEHWSNDVYFAEYHSAK
jgi:leucine-zipper-like transcriptional regulator 1